MFIDNNRVTRSDVNQRILAACAYHKQSDESDWISDLKKNCLAQKQHQTTVLLSGSVRKIQQTMISTVDTVMDALGSYTVLFNQDADFELSLSVTAPAMISEGSDENGRSRTVYSGRISSRSWSLVVSTKENYLEFLLVPSAQLLHLARIDNLGEPLCVLKAIIQDRTVFWQLRDEFLHSSELGKIYQEAFKILIETIYRDMDDIVEKRNLEGRQPAERRQNDRRKAPLWQGLTSPLVDRRIASRRSAAKEHRASGNRRNRVEKHNTVDAQAYRISPPDLNVIIQQAELFNARKLDIETAKESSGDDGWTNYCSAELQNLEFSQDWLAYSEEGYKPLSEEESGCRGENMELTAFDRALLKLLQEPEEISSIDSDSLEHIPTLEISSSISSRTGIESLLAEQESIEAETEYASFLEEDLDTWIREILSIEPSASQTNGDEIDVPRGSALIEDADEEDEEEKEEQEGLAEQELDEDDEEFEEEEDEQFDEEFAKIEHGVSADVLAPGSEEHNFLQALSRMAFAFDSSANVSLEYLPRLAGGGIMGTATNPISQSLNELIEEEENALSSVVKIGMEAFTQKHFEQVETCLKEAILRKRVMELMNGLKAQWSALADLQTFIVENTADIVIKDDSENANKTAEERLKASLELTLASLMQLGSQAFQRMNFEQVHKICKHAANLQRFQKRVDEFCGDGQYARQVTSGKSKDLIAA